MTGKLIHWTELAKLFTVKLCLDDKARILHASDTTKRYVPELTLGESLFEYFTFLRPARADNLQQLSAHNNSLILMKTHSERFAARGQLIDGIWENQEVLCFCGSPWLFWMNTNCPDVKLGMGDFSAQDAQLDQLFLMTTEQRMVNDLEKLNAELKRAKIEAERAQETKNALFARMSHEMRTPLSGVVSALSLLADEPLNSDAQELLSLAESSSRNLLHVINYILDTSKMEAGDGKVEPVHFEVSALLRSVADIVRARAVEKNIELLWRVSKQLSDTYLGDKAKLRQCLLNLATNGLKFTRDGSVVIRALPSLLGRPGFVRFEVEDTGVGISQADQERVFDPFWTASDESGPLEEGTGLGLDIVKQHVKNLGGVIGVISQEGKGSLFWFEVPLEESTEPADPHEAPKTDATLMPSRFRGRVLLVDDNQTNLTLGRMILQSLGVTVAEASDGALAAEMALQESFDLVLMDISMPIMDGVEATKLIRAQRSAQELPIVALTAYAYREDQERFLAAGMNASLAKPIVRDRLAEQLNRWLEADDLQTVDTADGSAQASSDSKQTPLLAISVLEELRKQIGDSNLNAVLHQFQSEVEDRWEALRQAAISEDIRQMTREAHTLASTCRSLGLAAAGEHFSDMETQLRRTGQQPNAGLEQSEELLTSGLDALRTYLSGT